MGLTNLCIVGKAPYNSVMNDRVTFEPDPVIEAYKKDVDRTLIRENLRLTVEQRLDNLVALQRFAEELRRAPKEKPLSGD